MKKKESPTQAPSASELSANKAETKKLLDCIVSRTMDAVPNVRAKALHSVAMSLLTGTHKKDPKGPKGDKDCAFYDMFVGA